jgi:broad specificity phosphatase PhoE
MSTLIMVRHGQASFGAADYDKLSPLGIDQSAALGAFWARRGQRLDAIFSGEQERQAHTLDRVRDAYVRQGLAFPEPRVLAAFNEYDADGIMRGLMPRLLEQERAVGEGMETVSREGIGSPAGKKAFQRVFEVVMDRWLHGEGDAAGVESWQGFRDRVLGGVRCIRDAYPTGKTVAVFTSGGPVSAVMQHALGTRDRVALDLGWIIKNGSLTEFRYSRERFTLTGFNETPHFDGDHLVTYR